MENEVRFKDLLKRGVFTFLIVGVLFVILHNIRNDSSIFRIESIVDILAFTILGGLLYAWSMSIIIKFRNRKKEKEKM